VCFALEQDDRIAVGNTIFDGGPGKTWSPEDYQTTLDTLRRVILAWPDETRCSIRTTAARSVWATSAAPSRRSSQEITAVSAGTPRGGCERRLGRDAVFSSINGREAFAPEPVGRDACERMNLIAFLISPYL
jgi:hypothetical protein